VEAEVYAMASLFISLLLVRFTLGTRHGLPRKPMATNYLIGYWTVFGGTLHGSLTIPSIGLLYFFKHYKTVTVKNFIIANVVVISILLFIFKLLLPLTMSFFAGTEVFTVNELGMPFDSGTILVTILLSAAFYFGLKYTNNKGLVTFNTLILCVLFVLIGFSTWTMLPIRANANVNINENKPSDAREVLL
jgi:hypothetical protein